MHLEANDFRRLIDLLNRHPEFNSARDRVRLLQRVFAGSPRGRILISNIDLEGPPRGVATEVVDRVTNFGQVDYGRPALGVLLSSIQDDVGDDAARYIADLFEKYPLDAQPVRARPVGPWKDTDEDPTEKIIGENTLLPISVLEVALAAARAVARIRVNPAAGSGLVGTGFLVARDLVMTCNHVIPDRDSLGSGSCEFNYQLDAAGRELPVTEVRPNRDGLFHTDAELDFSVFELETAVATSLGVPVRLAKKEAREGQRVAIIQHPGGRPKQISMHQNRVAFADQRIVQYVTSTEPGSSGAPVFDSATFEVVAVHNKGGHVSVPGKHGSYLRNQGSSARAILERLRELDADAHRRVAAGG
jgi:V8-like Glu-specific endopeptidase